MLKLVYIWTFTLILLSTQTVVHADIYFWKDKNGVRRYTNIAPPNEVTVQQRDEILFDEEAYESRRAREEQAELDRRIKMESEKNAQLLEKLKKTQKKLKQLERKTEKALETAKEAKKQSEKQSQKRRVIAIEPYPIKKIHSGLKPYPRLAPYSNLIPYGKPRSSKQFPLQPLPKTHQQNYPLGKYSKPLTTFSLD
jgi:citrate synthase